MNNPVIIAFDLETTGRMRDGSDRWQDQPGIVQIGAARIEYGPILMEVVRDFFVPQVGNNEWRITSRLKTFIDPEIPLLSWQEEAIEKTGITPAMVQDAPNLLMAHTALAEFFIGATHSLTFNGDTFDYPVLRYQLQRYGLDMLFPWPPCHIDLMKSATAWAGIQGKRGEKRPTLEELYEIVLGKKFEGAHDAGSDVDAMVEVFIAKGGLQGLGYL